MPTTATKAASAPTLVNVFESERASSEAVMRAAGASSVRGVYERCRRITRPVAPPVRGAGAARAPAGLAAEPVRGQLRHLRRQARGVALQHEQADLREHRLHLRRAQRLTLGQEDLLWRR